MRRNRKVKILATLGPASSDHETINTLHKTGADLFRINMSHTSHEKLRELVQLIRAVDAENGRPIGILADLQGPKLRLGTFAHGPQMLEIGQHFRLIQRRRSRATRRRPPAASGDHGLARPSAIGC
jgi:pyruvate kinase